LEQDKKRTEEEYAREGSIGLGYRVPLVIASPWSRGGAVCSQVFDHTSIIQFLEKFCSAKTGRLIKETNISSWRRAICGDLSSVFKKYNGEKIKTPAALAKDPIYESINNAQFKRDPSGYQRINEEEIRQLNKNPSSFTLMPRQEKGIRSSCALPYQLYADAKLSADRKTVEINFAAKNEIFGDKAAGAPFNAYGANGNIIRNYSVGAGDQLIDKWNLAEFPNQQYHFKINGPNGFYREFRGNAGDPAVDIAVEYARKKKNKLTGNIEVQIRNFDSTSHAIEVVDNAYKKASLRKTVENTGSGKDQLHIIFDLKKSFGWYDFTVKISGNETFERRYAGHVETGEVSKTDPLMGGIL
jgi:phospholipase C